MADRLTKAVAALRYAVEAAERAAKNLADCAQMLRGVLEEHAQEEDRDEQQDQE